MYSRTDIHVSQKKMKKKEEELTDIHVTHFLVGYPKIFNFFILDTYL